MPYQIEHTSRLIRLSFSGHATREDVRSAAREVVTLEGIYPHQPDQLMDLSAIERNDTDFDVLVPVATERRERHISNAFRLAMVAPTDLSFGLARMFQAMVDNPQITIRIFRSVPLAEAWLAQPADPPRP